MKGIIIISKFWTGLFSFKKANGVTIFPFIFFSEESLVADKVLINHERIHIQQALEMMILPFYSLYLIEFLIRYIHCRSFNKAYRSISFEKEAYLNQYNLHYLSIRKRWAFIKYF
ncbi:hypothetical protein [Sphingobacterium rhinopitheci]|uniref:hypothetical protein n=1 Tax=Sphingobacterium rhinopitheci TaxID=2781960 RepID=UPI001F51DE5C|nr:hypothetical protein [Sphingobacterium rhinopitheci]